MKRLALVLATMVALTGCTATPAEVSSGDPAAVLAELVAASDPPSDACLDAMSALADTDDAEYVQTQFLAEARTVEECATAGEYVLALKAHPDAWGMTDASSVDADAAPDILRFACSDYLLIIRKPLGSAPTCLDAEANGLL